MSRFLVPGIDAGQNKWWQAGGVMGCVAAYQPLGAASLAASYINRARPGTYDAFLGVAPTWNAVNGWTFNGTTQFLRTGITPAANWSVFVRFTGVSTSGNLFGEGYSGTAQFRIVPSLLGAAYYVNGGTASQPPVAASGILAMVGDQAYRDGMNEGLTIPAWSGTAYEMFIGARRKHTIPPPYADGFQACSIQALAIYDATSNLLGNPTRIAAVVSAIQNLPP